ncbi:MAG: anti-sigma factor [Gammaproteobacteria bacterium]|nr:anti-sigma factor [Gammaproteobacteria bacterium]
MNTEKPISENELHAYADNLLDPARRSEVEHYLEHHPEAAAMIRHLQQLDQSLHNLFDPVLAEPIPASIQFPPIRRHYGRRAAAAMAWVALGAVLGWSLNHRDAAEPANMLETQLVKPAAFAHVIYSAEVLHPVEVKADQEQHLVQWLSKRLSTPINAPNLAEGGYRLVGGRLLPSTDRMAAQFMYEDSSGRRVTLYLRRGAWDNKLTAFRYSRDANVGVFYWIDGELGYALSGELDKAELLKLAVIVHPQLNP